MSKVFITGAYGFVGKHLQDLLQDTYSLITPSHTELDITKKDQLSPFLSSHMPEFIIHLAGLASTWQETPENLMEVNFLGTLKLYEAVIQLKKEKNYQPKILYISSSDVYGEGSEGQKFTEDAPLRPLNFYGTSKAASDILSYQISKSEGLSIAIIRPFPHTGSGQKQGFFVPDMASQIAKIEKGEQPPEIMVGNLTAYRDYLHVKDVVASYKKIMEVDFENGEAFNVCSGEPIQMEKLLTKLLSLSHKKITIKTDPKRVRSHEASYRVGDNSKLQRIGWKPLASVDEALNDCLVYYRKRHEM